MYKKIICILMILLLCGCTSSSTTNKLIIDKIKINEDLLISSINEDVNGIVMFYEYGRPDVENTNTVIGAHSGVGDNAYFNDLNKIEIGDTIEVLYNDVIYEYLVINVLIVDKSETSILNNSGYSSLTLLTCDLSNLNNRVIIFAKLS